MHAPDPIVLVTGGAGYIGSHICKALKGEGFFPVVLDTLQRGHAEFVKWGPLKVGRVGDKELVKEIFLQYKPVAVIHCAAYADVSESFSCPEIYYQNNVGESLALLQAMKESSIEKLIFSSTCAIYGDTAEDSIAEEHPQLPLSPYGRSKLFVEKIIQDLAATYPLRYGILRYFNVAGADPEGEIGEKHQPENHLIPKLLEASPENIFSIYGSDFPTPDGTAIRDYIHVQDLAEGHVKALKYLFKGGDSFAVNLGAGKGFSVKEVVQAAQSVIRTPISIQFAPRRKGDPARLVSNIQKASSLLRWYPKCSDLTTIFTTAWAWSQASWRKSQI